MKQVLSKERAIELVKETVIDLDKCHSKTGGYQSTEEFLYLTNAGNLKTYMSNSVFGKSDNLVLIRVKMGTKMVFNHNLQRHVFPRMPKVIIEFFPN